MPPWPGSHGTEPNWVSSACMGLVLVILITAGVVTNYVDQQVKASNDQWRTAAAPIFEARGKPEMADQATPEDLAHFLDPCYSVDYRERTLTAKCGRTITFH